MASDQIISIIGSTGVQGSGVLKALLGSTSHPVRALTKSPAKLRPHPHLTPVEIDITNSASLREGLKGSWAFVNTFSDYSKPEGTEVTLLKSIIDAAVDAGVQYLAMSALPAGMPARAYIEKSTAMEYAKELSMETNLKPIFVQVCFKSYV